MNNIPQLLVTKERREIRWFITEMRERRITATPKDLVWGVHLRDSLIESLLLGVPIGGITLFGGSDDNLSIVDGVQRLLTIEYFINGRFSFRGRWFLDPLEEQFYADLTHEEQARIERASVPVDTIQAVPNIQFLSEIRGLLNINGRYEATI